MQTSPRTSTRPTERRRFQRVNVVFMGRYMLEDRREFPCQSINMSIGGVAVIAKGKGQVGERVIMYLDQVGRLEGLISRLFDEGFAINFNVPAAKREKLADQLTWFANRDSLNMPEGRRHERIVPNDSRISVKIPEGPQFVGRIIDYSISGCAVACDQVLEMGMTVFLGSTPGRVVRSSNTGFAVEFHRMLPIHKFDANYTL